MHKLISQRNAEHLNFVIYATGAFLVGFIFAYVDLLRHNSTATFINSNPGNQGKLLSDLIPLCSVDLQYAVLLVAILVIILSVIFLLSEFNNDNTRTLFALLPMDYSDVAISNILISGYKVALIGLYAMIPYIIIYGIRVFGLLSPALLPWKFKSMIVFYTICFPLIILLTSFLIFEIIEILLLISYIFLPNIRRKLKIIGSSPLLNLAIISFFTAFGFGIWNNIKYLTKSNLSLKIYGYFPVSYITRSIIDITRPVPNLLFPLEIALALLFLSLVFFICIIGLSLMTEFEYGCNSSNQIIYKNNFNTLHNTGTNVFSVVKILPIFVRVDLYNFIRNGKTFRWLINSSFFSSIIAIVFVLPEISSEKANYTLHINLFGTDINYFALMLLAISITELAQLAIYVFNYEKVELFLTMKLTPVNLKKLLLGKLISVIIVSFSILSIILVVIMFFFAKFGSNVQLWIFLLQNIALFYWAVAGNFYVGGVKTNLRRTTTTISDLHNSSISIYSTVVMLVSAGIIFALYALIIKLPLLFAFAIIIFEMILPTFALKKIMEKMEKLIQSTDFCEIT